MRKSEVENLNHGLYKLHWKKQAGGGFSLAAVGSLADGTRWFAATNWIDKEKTTNQKNWERVKRAELILAR